MSESPGIRGANALRAFHDRAEGDKVWWPGEATEDDAYNLALRQLVGYLERPQTDKQTRKQMITLAMRIKHAKKDPTAKAALLSILEGLGGDEDEQADEVPEHVVDQDEVTGGGEPRAELGSEGSDRGGREGGAGT